MVVLKIACQVLAVLKPLWKASPRFREWCVLISTELMLDGSQPLFTLPQLRLSQAVSILRA